ncbi:hypothetical protein ACLB2K_007282 [Fragaria x ananassa]
MPPRRRPRVATSSNANEGDDVRGLVDSIGDMLRDKMERAFESIELPEEKKVKMAVFFLDDSDHHWWTLARRNNDSAQTMTWEQYKVLFLGQYFNHSHRSRIQALGGVFTDKMVSVIYPTFLDAVGATTRTSTLADEKFLSACYPNSSAKILADEPSLAIVSSGKGHR